MVFIHFGDIYDKLKFWLFQIFPRQNRPYNCNVTCAVYFGKFFEICSRGFTAYSYKLLSHYTRKSHYNYRDVKSTPSPPQKKKGIFLGEVCFSRSKSWIFEFGGQNCFWWQKDLDRTFRPICSRPSAISGHQFFFLISKISKISVFEGKFCDFFFKNKIFV